MSASLHYNFGGGRETDAPGCPLPQEIGVDTTDWQRINEFCKHPRICGKEFARIRLDEMEDFQRKLRAIKKKGGLKEKEDVNNPGRMVMYIPLDGIPHA